MAGLLLKHALDLTTAIDPGATDLVDIPRSDVQVRVTRLDPATPVAPPAVREATGDAHEADPDVTEDDTTTPQPMASGSVTYSSLEKWRACGLRRYLERDLGLQAEGQRTSADTTGEDTLAAGDPDRDGREFGALVHETLEHVDWAAGIDIDDAVDRARRREAARAHPRPLTDEDERRLRACLKNAQDHPVAATLATATVQTEVPFATLIGGHLITGVIDVLATLPDGSALIVDWKTGQHFDDHEADYDLQRRIYTLALLDLAEGPDTVEALWLHLEGDGHEQRYACDAAGRAALRDALAAEVTQALGAEAVNAVDEADARCLGCPGLTRVCPVALAAAASA
jgi:hypothetical protein